MTVEGAHLRAQAAAAPRRPRRRIVLPERSDPPLQAALAGGGYLVGHGLAARAVERDRGFGRIEALHLARDRRDLNPVQDGVGGVGARRQAGTGVLDFAADRGIEGDQPDLAAAGKRISGRKAAL